ncbi:acetyltransferase GNAT family [Butyrivibrio proteoclasticus B316]|uniref:Acetyltransferase GNAT family n=1 Tax=Butyrivibrio proteoclasticus (strain ATCC 51982 / DSM 14932 / B316) TaxID=515622 RepID=E0RWP5_BUTPB|nr:GNAT family N-acetyltransferase [Butyrivibrio proteoclasticus]ADL34571.1 acetyltransferase GNAT family [Butyrivibrio proteoclasticus B316]
MGFVLETERLILRGWRDEDAPSLFKYASDERIGPVAGWLPHKDINYSRAVIRTIFAKDEVYAICIKGGGGNPVGSIGLTLKGSPERPLEEASAELGYWIGYPFWNHGYVTEAVKELMRHGFEDLGLETIVCGYFDGNDRSKRVQEKCGFTYRYTNENSNIPMLSEVRVEHMGMITRDEYYSIRLIQG